MFESLHPGLVTVAMHHIARNDTAHRTAHIMQVANEAVRIAKRYNLDKTRMLLATLLHDIYSGRNRVDHHILAAAWVRKNLGKYGYSDEVVDDVALMCAEHRDSGNGMYSNTYCEAFAAADRGMVDFVASVERSMGGLLMHFSEEQILDNLPRIVEMLKKKFGPNGYSCKNNIHDDYYRLNVLTFYRTLDLPYDALVKVALDGRMRMNVLMMHPDMIAHDDLYYFDNGIMKYNPDDEEFIDYMTGLVVPAHEADFILGQLQAQPTYYKDKE